MCNIVPIPFLKTRRTYSLGAARTSGFSRMAIELYLTPTFRTVQTTTYAGLYPKPLHPIKPSFREDVDGLPGSETFSKVVAGGLVDGWNEYDLLSEELVVSGDFWVGIKAFSSTAGIGWDNSSSGNSYSRTGTAGDWDMLDGEFMVRLLLDGEGGGGTSCAAGDVNADGLVNVLDIVTVVNFIMLTSEPNDDEACAADFNEDGLINVLDIVNIVNVIMGS